MNFGFEKILVFFDILTEYTTKHFLFDLPEADISLNHCLSAF